MTRFAKNWWITAARLSPIPTAFVDPDDRFIWVNAAWTDMLGYATTELIGRQWQEITHPEDVGGDLDNVQRVKSGKLSEYYLEKRYRTKSGSYIRIGLYVHRYPPPSSSSDRPTGQHEGYVVFTQPLHQHSENAMHQLQAEFERLSSSVELLQEHDLQTRTLDEKVDDLHRAVNRNAELINSLVGRGGNVRIGGDYRSDSDDTGRDKVGGMDAQMVRYLVAAVIALAAAVVWIAYYSSGGTEPPPKQGAPIIAPEIPGGE